MSGRCRWLRSISGGTDIVGCFVLGDPTLPVRRGEIQSRSLGLDVRALPRPDAPAGSATGELVCANPFPSRPLGFYGDRDGARFHAAYFAQNPGFWTHGDLIEFAGDGMARIHGRSDGVLKVGGIRIGPAEIYGILDDIPEIRESLAVEQRQADGPGQARIVLLVVMRRPGALDATLKRRIRGDLARRGSPAHVPDLIVEVAELPVTHSGKRSERAGRDAVNGDAPANAEALRNPGCLAEIRRRVAAADAALQKAAPRLMAAGDGAAGDGAAGDGLEERLRRIWESVLDISPIGLDESFFDLGGKSLAA